MEKSNSQKLTSDTPAEPPVENPVETPNTEFPASPAAVVESKKSNVSDTPQAKSKAPVVNEKEKKKQAFVTRTIWSLVMLFGFFILLQSGHFPLILFVVLCQILIFKEIITMTSEPARDKNLPYNKFLNWYFLIATVYYLDGESIFGFLNEIHMSSMLMFWYKNHKMISYSMYLAGFIFFVSTLKKGFYKFQFAQLCASHMTLVIVVFQSHLIIDNILSGIFWFFLPSALVIVNDIFAYLCGITFGRTQLIEISPKKTVEGFLGAWICTGFAAVIISYFLSKSDYLICPATNLNTTIYNYPHCEPNPVFISQLYQLPTNIAETVGFDIIFFKPVYFHAAVLATFASLIAPFGGFFASGLKRAFGIKDFGDTIPGHGGMTDRFDCQLLMGSFSYLYIQTFIAGSSISLSKLLQMAVFNLSNDQILQLVKALLKYLRASGALEQDTLEQVFELLA